MAIQNGLKRITKIYHGNDLVYDDKEGRWQNIDWKDPNNKGNGTFQFMATHGLIVFKGTLSSTINDTIYPNFTIPSPYKVTGILSGTRNVIYDGSDDTDRNLTGLGDIRISGNTISCGGGRHINTSQILLTYTK